MSEWKKGREQEGLSFQMSNYGLRGTCLFNSNSKEHICVAVFVFPCFSSLIIHRFNFLTSLKVYFLPPAQPESVSIHSVVLYETEIPVTRGLLEKFLLHSSAFVNQDHFQFCFLVHSKKTPTLFTSFSRAATIGR